MWTELASWLISATWEVEMTDGRAAAYARLYDRLIAPE